MNLLNYKLKNKGSRLHDPLWLILQQNRARAWHHHHAWLLAQCSLIFVSSDHKMFLHKAFGVSMWAAEISMEHEGVDFSFDFILGWNSVSDDVKLASLCTVILVFQA